MTRPRDTQQDTLPLSRTSAALARGERGADALFSLLIYHRDGVRVAALPAGAELTIGRGSPSQVIIDDRTLSRRHAQFSLQTGKLVVTDLGSTNGTEVRGERIEQAELRPGEIVTLGAVVISPHMRGGMEPLPPGLDSHESFAATLDGEIVRARHFGDSLAVVHVESFDAKGGGDHVSHWWRWLSGALRPVDTAALYSARAVELLMPRIEPDVARARAHELVAAAPRGRRILCGVATYPGSGDTPDQLFEAAQRAMRLAGRDAPVSVAPLVREPPARAAGAGEVVPLSAAMRELYQTIDRLAGARLPVLIHGETGSGKEVVARALHARGSRANAPLVCVNCGAIPSQLVESTLFGHERGAFTGASQSAPGVFGAARGGSVLLDEVGELPDSAQAALLRVLDTGRVTPVGSAREIDVDARVIAATHRDLGAMCEQGSFRRDLWFRLNAFTLYVPPLRERREEIAPLARQFLADVVERGASSARTIAPDALDALERYDWPGNVRELRNAIERAAVIADGAQITREDLPRRVAQLPSAAPAEPAPDDALLGSEEGLKVSIARIEKRLIEAALQSAGGRQVDAARLLKIPVRTLSDKIRRHRIVVD